jgi:hypothetical protein
VESVEGVAVRPKEERYKSSRSFASLTSGRRSSTGVVERAERRYVLHEDGIRFVLRKDESRFSTAKKTEGWKKRFVAVFF